MDNSMSVIMKKMSQYESEISSILGMLVVAALAVFIFLFVKRFMPKPVISPVAETTQDAAENLMKTQADKNSYTVKAGDGLTQIAQQIYKNKAMWKEIAKANNLKAPYTLEKGQVLKLPEAATVPEAKTESKKIAVAPVIKPEEKTVSSADGYIVKKGDHLWKIAQTQMSSGYDWVKIYKANRKLIGKNPGVIRVGMVLVIPQK